MINTLAVYINGELFYIEMESVYLEGEKPVFQSINQLFDEDNAKVYRSLLSDEQKAHPLIDNSDIY